MKECPICGSKHFLITVHVSETWIVDKNGIYEATHSKCNGIDSLPTNNDIWQCFECGYEAEGNKFEIRE